MVVGRLLVRVRGRWRRLGLPAAYKQPKMRTQQQHAETTACRYRGRAILNLESLSGRDGHARDLRLLHALTHGESVGCERNFGRSLPLSDCCSGIYCINVRKQHSCPMSMAIVDVVWLTPSCPGISNSTAAAIHQNLACAHVCLPSRPQMMRMLPLLL